MISFTSQQRLQHRIGLGLNDYVELEIEFETSCAAVIAERLDRCIETLPLRHASLERASKYSALPAIRPVPPGDVKADHRATIAVECDREDGLTIRFLPLLWDVFSVLELLEASLGAEYPLLQMASPGLFQDEAASRPGGQGSSSRKLALASPKTCQGSDGVHRAVAHLPLDDRGAQSEADLIKAIAERSFREGDLIAELPMPGDHKTVIGNLSYFVPMADGRETVPRGEILAAHSRLAQQPDAVALGVGVVMLPHIPGVAGIAYRGAARGMAAQVAVYRSPKQLVVSAAYAATAFSARESSNHFRDLASAIENGRAERSTQEARGAGVDDTTIAGMLLKTLSHEPDRVVVRTPDRSYSRGELLDQARTIAAQIPGRPQRVGIYCRNSIEFVAAVAGCILRGICYVPLDRHAGSAKLMDIVESASLEFALCAAHDEAKVRALGLQPLVVEDKPKPADGPLAVKEAPGPIYRVYTSGTTGKPKPVEVSDSNLRALFSSYADVSTEIYTMTWGFTSSIGFDASVKQYLGPLLYGGCVFIPSTSLTQDTIGVLRQLKAHDVDILNLTPQLLRIAVDADLCHFRFVLVSGDTLPPRLVEDFYARTSPPVQLVNLYGPTETTINAMAYSVGRNIRYQALPIGRALGSCRVEVQDASGDQQPYCSKGSLKIFGDIVTNGHLHADGERFGQRNGVPCFDSGDECFVWYDDLVYFVGRNDRQIKINGIRVNLEEIASWLREYLGVATCYVGAIGQRVYAALVRQELTGKEDSVATLADASRLGRVPVWPIIVDAIPVDVNGKVRLAELLAQQQGQSGRENEPVQDILELDVHGLMQAALGRRGLGGPNTSRLGVNDNLFEHGLDSLLAMEVALDLSTRFNVELSPGELATHPTSRQVTGLLRSRQTVGGLIQLTGLRERERLVLLLPPVLGSSLVFAGIVEQLSADHLVAACTYPPVHEGAGSIEEIARAIVDELQRKDLLGYRIDVVGYSMGGSVGFELCRQLEPVARLSNLYILDKPIRPRGGLLAQQRAGDRLLEGFIAGKSISEKLKAHLARTMGQNIETVVKYVPRGTVSVPTHLFVCTQEEEPVSLSEWGPYLRGERTVTELDCSHDEVLATPHIDVVLASLAANLAPTSRLDAAAPVG